MPLIRKTQGEPSAATPASTPADERWLAARSADDAQDVGVLAASLRTEQNARVREAQFTSLARIGTPQSAAELLKLLRTDEVTLRTGALDALRTMVIAVRPLLPELLADPDVDVRVLSCELARSLPGEEGSQLLCELLARESDVNVCAAAIDVLAEIGGPAAVPVLADCARRFGNSPFLGFAVTIAIDRINAQPASSRA